MANCSMKANNPLKLRKVFAASLLAAMCVFPFSTANAQSLESKARVAAYRQAELNGAAPVITSTVRNANELESKTYRGYSEGDFVRVRASHYCPCAKCNGAENAGITASGKSLKVGMCALNWLPLGSIVEVRGKRYVVEDRGVGTGRIDIYVTSHSYAYELGIFYDDLEIIRIGR